MVRLFTTVLFILFYTIPLYALDSIPQELIGHWVGVSGDSKIDQRAIIGAGSAKKDIGHQIESFEFDITNDGHITGRGIALYWFNVSAAIPLAAANAHLDGNIIKTVFSIEGNVTKKGVFITSKTAEKLPLISAGKRQLIDAWNVFGPESAKLDNKPDGLSLSSTASNTQPGMTLEWKAKKEEGKLIIYDVKTPSPDNSFISTDEVKFRAKVEKAEQFNALISWSSEDGKVDNNDSCRLEPASLENNPDYSTKPNPPASPNGRGGKLSYKVTASVNAAITEKEKAIVISQDELDQLRQEYVDMNKNRIPQRDEFTRSYRNYNFGAFSWAIIKPVIIEGYAIVVRTFKPNETRLNCAYRSPVHNAKIGGKPESRHIYGDALDLQTPSIGHSGPPNYEDWKALYRAAQTANPLFIEDYNQSGAGHVHIDWRP